MLWMGDVGTGKTTNALSIALSKPQDEFHYLMADRDPSKLYEEWGGKPDNWYEYDAFEYTDARDIIKNLASVAKLDPAHHWIIVDTVTQMYKTAADGYAQLHYGTSIGELIMKRTMEQRKLNEAGKATKADDSYSRSLVGGLQAAEWMVIKDIFYRDIVWPLIKRTRAHVILISHPRAIDVFGDGKLTRKLPEYLNGTKQRVDELGYTLDSQKDLPKMVDTWLYFSVAPDSSQRYMYTLKESGKREWLNKATEFSVFWPDYERLVINGNVPHVTT